MTVALIANVSASIDALVRSGRGALPSTATARQDASGPRGVTADAGVIARSIDGDTYSRGVSAGGAATDAGRPTGADGEPLSDREIERVDELSARDAEVRAHEQAHAAAAGPLLRGGPNYEYTTGPDGRQYATGGNVQIDTSPEADPRETVTKAQRIRAAALAPAEPSSTDLSVAAKASRMEAEARAELIAEGEDSGATPRADGGPGRSNTSPTDPRAEPATSAAASASAGSTPIEALRIDVYA